MLAACIIATAVAFLLLMCLGLLPGARPGEEKTDE